MCWLYSEGLARQARLYRTRLCKYRSTVFRGLCPYGQLCRFAHAEYELRMPEMNELSAQHVKWTYLRECGYEAPE